MVQEGSPFYPPGVIDWRNYLEDELNMHNSHPSFAARQRMLDYDGNASNQVIWFTDVADPNHIFDQTPEALDVMDAWMQNILAHPEKSVAENKPPLATDRCFDANGVEIASGPHVWDGILDYNPPGICTQHFKIYGTSCQVAGGPSKGSIFKCQLISVSDAMARGDYGIWTPDASQTAILERIFP
jgi:hypothetical protein